MRQVLIKGGAAIVEDVPAPSVSRGSVLVQVQSSCISVGTEVAGVRMSGLPLYRRALQQPENVRRVLEMARDQGIRRTVDRVSGKLAAGSPTGYSAAGRVIAIGEGVIGFTPGDIVACAGAGIANHAEVIDVPVNLAVPVPSGIPADIASTVTLGAIALQGVRRAAPTLGENVVVVGLGILGQLAVQLLVANGCRVIGVDPDPTRIALASELGMDHALDPADEAYVQKVHQLTGGFGADAVIITAANSSDAIISQGFNISRKKGRVVLVGDVGLHIKRSDIYAKELDLLVSCSYGPGRYDPVYELDGRDYPLAYVRWTENRNMSAYLDLIARGRLNVAPLVQARFPIEKASEAFGCLSVDGPKPLAVVLTYPEGNCTSLQRKVPVASAARSRSGALGVGILGAGGFLQGTHLPNLVKLRKVFQLRGVMSRTGANAKAVAHQYQASYATTEVDDILSDEAIDVVIIGTRHNLHADLALKALAAGKHVLVEKPLAVSDAGLRGIEEFYRDNPGGPILLTGFNRRFSPAAAYLRRALSNRTSPIVADYRMNAGHIPADHWVQGAEGAGRNIGEACHIYDLFLSLTGGRPVHITASAISANSTHWQSNDNFVATVKFDDGSLCTLTYTSIGAKSYPKERMEIFCGGAVLSLDDYRSASTAGLRVQPWAVSSPDKGHLSMLQAFGEAVRDGAAWPIDLQQQIDAARISFEVERMIHPGADWFDTKA